MRGRIEQALRELPLSEEDIAQVAPQLAEGFLLRDRKITKPDSSFFRFRDKIHAVVDRFRQYGLTLPDYLQAALKQPSLFTRSPATVVGNIKAVAYHFREHGLTLPDYLQAALKQPCLFSQAPVTITGNIEAVAKHFREHGLT